MKSVLSNRSNLQQRVIAGILGGIFIITAIYWSEWSYFFLFLTIGVLAQLEFYKIMKADYIYPLNNYGTMCGAYTYTIIFLVERGTLTPTFYISILPIVFIIFLAELYRKKDKPFTNIAFTVLGIVYVALPFALLHVAAFRSGSYSWQIILGSLFLLWASDSGAYFSGISFGKNKLFERVSPKKTWEGSIGGALLSLFVAYVLSIYFIDLELWQWLVISVIIVVIGSFGDLVESLLKRSIAIKDSGSLIPGHGGLLDRFDGLLLASPFIAAFIKLFA